MTNPKIQENAAAPDFTLTADDETTVTLSALRGQPVVLYFYPKDDTPGCTNEACDFRDSLDALTALGAVVLGVSPDSVTRHQKFKTKYDLNFRLLADPDHAVAEDYGVWRLKKFMGREYDGIVRSTFVIDAAGKIAAMWDKVQVRKTKKGEIIHRHVDDVRAAVEAL